MIINVIYSWCTFQHVSAERGNSVSSALSTLAGIAGVKSELSSLLWIEDCFKCPWLSSKLLASSIRV